MPDKLKEQIEEFELTEHRDFLVKLARPAINLMMGEGKSTPGCSKAGGSPDVPRDFEWPEHEVGPYRFVCQVNLANLPKGTKGLPAAGLLSFFYAHDEEGEVFWQDPDYVRAYHFKDLLNLQAMKPPKAVRLGSTCTIELEATTDVPPWPWNEPEVSAWPIDESLKDAYWQMRLQLHDCDAGSLGFLLGYPLNTTLGYDPTPGPTWTSLLTLASEDDLEWCWHDGDWLVAFIEKQRLRAADFSEIKSDAG